MNHRNVTLVERIHLRRLQHVNKKPGARQTRWRCARQTRWRYIVKGLTLRQ